jgi:hypothetical protein
LPEAIAERFTERAEYFILDGKGFRLTGQRGDVPCGERRE